MILHFLSHHFVFFLHVWMCCWRLALIFSSKIWCVQVSDVKSNILVKQIKLFHWKTPAPDLLKKQPKNRIIKRGFHLHTLLMNLCKSKLRNRKLNTLIRKTQLLHALLPSFYKKRQIFKNGWMQEMEMYAITWKKEGQGRKQKGQLVCEFRWLSVNLRWILQEWSSWCRHWHLLSFTRSIPAATSVNVGCINDVMPSLYIGT